MSSINQTRGKPSTPSPSPSPAPATAQRAAMGTVRPGQHSAPPDIPGRMALPEALPLNRSRMPGHADSDSSLVESSSETGQTPPLAERHGFLVVPGSVEQATLADLCFAVMSQCKNSARSSPEFPLDLDKLEKIGTDFYQRHPGLNGFRKDDLIFSFCQNNKGKLGSTETNNMMVFDMIRIGYDSMEYGS